MWPLLALTGASALMGSMNAREQQKQQKAQNLAAAEQTRQSPWTGMGAGKIETGGTSPLAAGLQSGLGGYMAGQNIEKGMAETKLAEAQLAEKAAAKKMQEDAAAKIAEQAAAEATRKAQLEEAKKLALSSSANPWQTVT